MDSLRQLKLTAAAYEATDEQKVFPVYPIFRISF
jgi:hypothetical protein